MPRHFGDFPPVYTMCYTRLSLLMAEHIKRSLRAKQSFLCVALMAKFPA